MSAKIPKVVSIRISRARGLQIDESQVKKKKISHQWRVICIGGGKKQVTPTVEDSQGSPAFNCDVKVKLPRKSVLQPIILLVVNSHDCHVGQVIISPTSLPGIPDNCNLLGPEQAQSMMFSPQNLRCDELEQTKKNSNPHGYLYYWCYVEEFADASGKDSHFGSISSGLNLQSQSNLNRSNTSLFSGSKSNLKILFQRGSKKSSKGEAAAAAAAAQNSSASVSRNSSILTNYGAPDVRTRSMGNVFYNSHDDSKSLSASEGSVILHSDYREQADGRGDSEASSVHTMHTLPLVREIPPSPTTFGTGFMDNVHRNSLSEYQSGARMSISSASPKMGEFQIFPEYGPLKQGFPVTLYGNQLRHWIRDEVVTVRVHDHSMSMADCVDFKGHVDSPDNQVLLHMPAMQQSLKCYITLETRHMGTFDSTNVFTYGSTPIIGKPPLKAVPPVQDVRRSASYGPQSQPPLKLKSKPSSGAAAGQKSTLRSIGGSLLNLAMGGTSGSSSKSGSRANLSSSTNISTANTMEHKISHERNQSDSQFFNTSSNSLLRNESLEAVKNRKYKSLTKKELFEMTSSLQNENAELNQRLSMTQQKMAKINDENVTLKSQLTTRNREIDDLSVSLCHLRLQLLDDGLTKYLELK